MHMLSQDIWLQKWRSELCVGVDFALTPLNSNHSLSLSLSLSLSHTHTHTHTHIYICIILFYFILFFILFR
jgi:hypothetical protein